MPKRKVPLIKGEIYHVINRGVASVPTFNSKRDYERFISAFCYYQYADAPVKYSNFVKLSNDRRLEIINYLKEEGQRFVKIICYCLMPNHFHFLLKSEMGVGIEEFVGKVVNSYTKYVNTKNKRSGPLFEGRFKAVRIQTDEQFMHVGRYIHLNPYSSCVVKTFEDLLNYPYSSLGEYVSGKEGFCDKNLMMSLFEKESEKYLKFVKSNADYQRSLEEIKHLTFE